MSKPFSQACENNKAPILEVLKIELADSQDVLEVGSGSAQHAVYFSRNMPHLLWQTSDLPEYHAGIDAWRAESGLSNVLAPLTLDVRSYAWGDARYDAVFTANSLHIMGREAAEYFVAQVGASLCEGGRFLAYGPFNYKGNYTSASNARFDQWLKQQNAGSAIRDFERLDECARSGGLSLLNDYEMPANNRLLVWQKQTAAWAPA